MDNYDKLIKQVLSENTVVPIKVKNQVNTAYSKVLSCKENENIREFIIMRKKHKKRLILLTAILTLVLGTTALASIKYWGLNDFFAKTGKQLPQQASSLIETNIAQDNVQNDLVHFKVREAICDNKSIYIVIEAKPVNPEKYLLLTMDTRYDDPTTNMGIETKNGETLNNYAKETNRQMLYVNPSLYDKETYLSYSADYTTEEDGTVVYILKSDNVTLSKKLTITCNTIVNTIDSEGNYGEPIKDSFDFQLTNKSTEVVVYYKPDTSDVVNNTGVIVDSIKLSKTELGLYSELTFHIASYATKETLKLIEEALWFEYLDESGNVWDSGLSGIGSINKISDNIFVQKNNFSAQELPGSVTIRGFDCMNKTRLGSVTLKKE